MDLQRTGFYSRRNNPEPARIQVPDGHVAHVHDQNGVITVFQSGEHYIPRHSRLHWMGPQEEAPDEKQAYSTT
jgi:hypothetical protein